jgi:hypothetical protein
MLVPTQPVYNNQVISQALSELMHQFSMDYMNISNDLGEWIIIRVDNVNVAIEFLGKEVN